MDIIIGRADDAGAAVRTLSWLATPANAWRSRPISALSGFMASTQGTTDDHSHDVCVMDADHKFSTRLGPTASPPV